MTPLLSAPLATLLAGAAAPPAAPASGGWVHTSTRQGVRLFLHTNPGDALPTFRAETTVDAPLEWVAARIEDGDHHSLWFHHTVDSRVLERRGGTWFVHHHLESPPPVAHRDVVLEVHREPTAHGVRFVFHAAAHPKAPVRPGWVRMPRLDGVFELTREGPTRTAVVYQVYADPGGRLPPWMARRGVRDIALHTLSNLRALAANRPR